ncbi:MAG: response regulator [Desulfonatronovibrionaceae bacterium]
MLKDGEIRVLLVDDEQTLLEFLARRLERQGFTVHVAFSGEEALGAVTENPYDVAVVNTNLSGMDGIRTQNMLREIQPDLQCIVITQMDCVSDALPWETQQCSFCRFLYKPVDFQSLASTIQELYKERQKEKKQNLQAEQGSFQSPPSGLRGFLRKLKGLYGIPGQ